MVIYMRQPVGSCCSWRLAALAAVRNEKDAAGGEKTGGSPLTGLLVLVSAEWPAKLHPGSQKPGVWARVAEYCSLCFR